MGDQTAKILYAGECFRFSSKDNYNKSMNGIQNVQSEIKQFLKDIGVVIK